MKIYWTSAILLSSALIAGCSDRAAENTPNTEQTAATGNNAAPAPGDEAAIAPAETAPPPATPPPAPAQQNPTPAPAPRPAPSQNTVQPAPRPAPVVTVREVTLPAGTTLPLELTTDLSSETATVEMPVTARLRDAVTAAGMTAIPAGSTFRGEVTEVVRPGRVQGRARLAIRFTSVTIRGDREDLRTNPVVFEGEATRSEDATKVGAGAGIGAALGALLGGGSGAAKGAAIGGAAGAGAVLATRGREVVVAAGTSLAATTIAAVDLPVR